MTSLIAALFLMDHIVSAVSQCTVPDSEFSLAGDFLIGGLFDVHDVTEEVSHLLPDAIDCSKQPFSLSNYRRFQVMRFCMEQINNSTQILPGVTLGYEIFDHCSDTSVFPGIFDFMSVHESVQPWPGPQGLNVPKVLSVVGTFTSTKTRTIAPLLTMDFIPMVNYGSSSSAFSEKAKYPTLLRTVLPNQWMVEVIVTVLLHFRWHWVAFLNDNGDYGTDGVDLFGKAIKDTEICLAYNKEVNSLTNHSEIFQQIETQKINVIIVFTEERIATMLIRAALNLKVNNKVWLATDAWAFNRGLMETPNIDSIGTVIGIAEPETKIPGFYNFISSLKHGHAQCEVGEKRVCNQVCDCNELRPEDIFEADPSYSFPVYASVHVIAHALHNLLQCGRGQCNTSMTIYPYMVLKEMQKSNFTLMDHNIQFNENGDPKFGYYSIVFWDNTKAEEVGYYKIYPSVDFYINSSKIQWYTDKQVPSSLCSSECPAGHARQQFGLHTCCFNCVSCPNGTYINSTVDPYTCVSCPATEWSTSASISCLPRLVEFVSFEDAVAILIMFGTVFFVVLSLLTAVLFGLNYNTPVVRSAGGPMCFLILGCLSLCSISVFFYFGKPKESYCIMRLLPFVLFYTVCLACFVVRSFQIVSIFKIAATYPSIQRWWMKYHGQWLVIALSFILQLLLLLITYTTASPKLYNETVWYPNQIVLGCETSLTAFGGSMTLFVILCFLCFVFSYMAKELPKNYNEAKAITFCLLLLALTWIIFATVFILYRGKHLQSLNALAVLSSLYSFLLWYFLPKCCIILFQPEKNTQQYFQGLIQSYTKTISQ
ncbi:taste receptor type 1 member 1-like [Boleophthalmus pectinirostris]|uniref:taste receptor type 1 member 1-like n=1 Tax=Boleophthalmus pectinirostris TaxID=150288 RepID=UPI00242ECF13|nr:taste receptor type 1 member 1-like [Boleophthalmus pectinirostris]